MKKIDINKVAALCIRDKKLLVVKSRKHPIYITLGGKKERGESDLECLQREVLEEIGCSVVNPVFFQTFVGKTLDQSKTVKMVCFLCELQGEIIPRSEIEAVAWIDRNFKQTAGLLDQVVVPALIQADLL